MNTPEPTLREILDAIHASDAKHERSFEEVFEVIQALSTHVDEQIDGLRSELRSEIKQESSALRSEMKQELSALRSETKAGFASVRQEMHAGFNRLEKKLDRHTVEINSLHIRVAHLESAAG